MMFYLQNEPPLLACLLASESLLGSAVGLLYMLGNKISQHELLSTWQEPVQEPQSVPQFSTHSWSGTGLGMNGSC